MKKKQKTEFQKYKSMMAKLQNELNKKSTTETTVNKSSNNR